MPVAHRPRSTGGPGPRIEDYAAARSTTDPSEPPATVNEDQIQGETTMSHDEIKDDPRDLSHTDDASFYDDAEDASFYDDAEAEDDAFYDDEPVEDEDAAPLVAVDTDAVSDPGHTFRVGAAPDRSRELQSILAQLQDDADAQGSTLGVTHHEAETNPQTTRAKHGKASGRKRGRGSYPSLEDDQGFQLGDAAFIDKEPGMEFFMSDDDSGPIPLTRDEFERHTNPGLDETPARSKKSRSPRGRTLPRARKTSGLAGAAAIIREHVGGLAERASALRTRFAGSGARRRTQGQGPVERRQIVIGLIVVLAVFGLGYAIFGGGGSDESSSSGDSSSAAAMAPITSAGPAASEPQYELVRLGTDTEGEASEPMLAATPPIEGGIAASASASPGAAPRGKPVDKKFEAQNVLVPSAVPASPQSHKLTRACILRKGPASRFALLKPLNPGDTLTVLATSSEDWEAVTVNGITGWAKGTAGPDTVLRMGPGEQFRTVFAGDDSPKPNGRVISSARWRYVKFGELYGWTGPACFK